MGRALQAARTVSPLRADLLHRHSASALRRPRHPGCRIVGLSGDRRSNSVHAGAADAIGRAAAATATRRTGCAHRRSDRASRSGDWATSHFATRSNRLTRTPGAAHGCSRDISSEANREGENHRPARDRYQVVGPQDRVANPETPLVTAPCRFCVSSATSAATKRPI